MTSLRCFHCGLPVPDNANFPVAIKGCEYPMCCPGCQAVALSIVQGGLEKFYDYRSSHLLRPEEAGENLKHYDLPEVQEDFVRLQDDGSCITDVAITGITCSACAWLIEHHLAKLKGLIAVSVNVSSHRCRIHWNDAEITFSALLQALHDIGYNARPAIDPDAEYQRQRENKISLLRLGIAGLGMMQAGMTAVALYAGEIQGMDPHWRHLLRWVSLVITTPVVFFSARPFYSTALRSLFVGKLVMDVPVSLAITLAFAASIWATITNTGEVYFDSVSMFTFFLLLGRYLEMRVRHRNEHESGCFSQLIPQVATRLGHKEQTVAVKHLKQGDRILVRNGETIPCDGEVVKGSSSVIEAVLTGEQHPVYKSAGDVISAGTVNVENPLEIIVSAVGGSTRLATILDFAQEAQAVKPHRAAIADKLSGWFVGAVLLIAAIVAIVWTIAEPSRALWVTLSVLVVTCPCALSLATPAALTIATGELRKRGLLIRKPHVLETLSIVSRCIFDKTGTLTQGKLKISKLSPTPGNSRREILQLAASLEKGSTHPIANAFDKVTKLYDVEHHRVLIGKGVTGVINSQPFALGSSALLKEVFGYRCHQLEDTEKNYLLLGGAAGCLGAIYLTDELRQGTVKTINALRSLGIDIELLSGDRDQIVAGIARKVGITDWQGMAAPEQKLARVRQLQKQGHCVLMVGDGVNDVPIISGSDISVAVGDAVDVARLHADCLLVSKNLDVLPMAIALARRTHSIIRQNLTWALFYNTLALPMTVLGYVPPWAAAIGMSASSLAVVANSLRLSSTGSTMPTCVTRVCE